MGTLFSKNKNSSNDYERILSTLDNDIQKKEIQVKEIRVNGHKFSSLWIMYSSLLWIIYIVYYIYALHDKYDDIPFIALTVFPIVTGPICIYYVRKTIKWIYFKRSTNIEQELITLKKSQKLKVEELKKKTAYYSTKSLLERYDQTSSQKEDKKTSIKENKQIAQQQQQVMARSMGPPPQPENSGKLLEITTTPQKSHWYDKLAEALVGDVGPETKYALICSKCFTHNGLVLPQEIDNIEYTCPHCHQFNPSRKSRMLHPNGPVSPTMSPTPPHEESLLDQENKQKSPIIKSTVLEDKEDQLRQRKTTADSN